MTVDGAILGGQRGPHSLTAGAHPTTARLPYLDALKVVLIAAIITGHAVLGYAAIGGSAWSYAEVREVTLAPITEIVLIVVAGPLLLTLVPLFFLIAGLLTPASLERKGPAGYVRDRLLRLGVPFLVFVFVAWPTFMHLVFDLLLSSSSASWWDRVVGADGTPDTGPAWFIGVLLIFSIGVGGWAWLRPPRPHGMHGRDIGVRHLLGLAAVVAIGTFAVRLVFPYGTDTVGDLNLWQWPACLAAFGVGIAAAERGWLRAVPARLTRHAGYVTLVAAIGAVSLVIGGESIGIGDELWGGWGWPALLMAALDATLALFGSVWLLSVAQHHLDRPLPFGPDLPRSAYLAFLLQGFVLIGLALAVRPIPVGAEIKALAVGVGGVAGSFGLASLLLRRVPLLARVV